MKYYTVLFHSGIIYSTVSIVFIAICVWGCVVLARISSTITAIWRVLVETRNAQTRFKLQIHEDAGAIFQEIKNINRLTMKAADEKNKKL